jgi:hypothetical protein
MPQGPMMDGQHKTDQSLSVVFASDAPGITLQAENVNIGDVDVVSLPALPTGTKYIGKTAIDMPAVSATPTLTVHATYVANDYIGTSGAAMQFANMVRENGGSAFIHAKMYSNVAQSIAHELWLFDAAITPPADSAAWSISDADMLHCIAVIPFSTWFQSAINSVSCPNDMPWVKCAAGSKDIWGCIVTRGAPTFADGDMTIKLLSVQN